MTRKATLGIAVALVCLGLAIVVETAVVGGELGYLLGALLVLAGALRIVLVRMA